MNIRPRHPWNPRPGSYWFVPSLMTVAAFGLSAVTINLDRSLPYDWIWTMNRLWAGGAPGARALLSTIGGGAITVAGVVFAITITTLVLASQQFGPYLLRHFLADRGNQVTLGTFVGTFVYCLVVLRTVREGYFVPNLSVFCAVLMALASVGMLIYFVHHISTAMQAENIIARVGREFDRVVERRYPAQPQPEPSVAPDLPSAQGRPVEAERSGYLQLVDAEGLARLAEERGLLLRLRLRPGEFVSRGGPLVEVWPPERCDAEALREVARGFLLGANRQTTQDVKLPIDQLVQIALRSLSPAINDTHTALICVDWLGSGLGHLARRALPSAYTLDSRAEVRLITEPVAFPEAANAAFNEIRQYATLPVALRLLETIARVAAGAHRSEDLLALRHQADLIRETSQDKGFSSQDFAEVELRYALATAALSPPAAG